MLYRYNNIEMEMATLRSILPKMTQMIATKLIELQDINEEMQIPDITALLQRFSEKGSKVVEIRKFVMENTKVSCRNLVCFCNYSYL